MPERLAPCVWQASPGCARSRQDTPGHAKTSPQGPWKGRTSGPGLMQGGSSQTASSSCSKVGSLWDAGSRWSTQNQTPFFRGHAGHHFHAKRFDYNKENWANRWEGMCSKWPMSWLHGPSCCASMSAAASALAALSSPPGGSLHSIRTPASIERLGDILIRLHGPAAV